MVDNSAANPHVFISYVRNNKRLVQRLCDHLTKHGVKVWLDRDNIEPGVRWQDAVEQAIQKGVFFIACFSKQYNERDKTYMNEELTLAIDTLRKLSPDRIWFIPIKLNRCEVPKRRISDVEKLINIQWVELYKDWDAGIQRILGVIQPLPNKHVEALIEILNSGDEVARMASAEALGKIGDNIAISALIDALSDECSRVREAAVDALGNIGDAAAVPALTKVLNDEARNWKVAAALGEIGDARAVPALIEALGNDGVRDFAAHALGQIGDVAAVPALIDIFNDGDDIVRGNAVYALGNIGEVAAVPALIKALDDEDGLVRQTAANALKNIGTPEALKAAEKYEKGKG